MEDKSQVVFACRDIAMVCDVAQARASGFADWQAYSVFSENPEAWAQIYAFPRGSGQVVCEAPVLVPTIIDDVDGCGDGIILINWSTPEGEFVCTARVFVNSASQFNPWEIKWPKHYDGEVEYGVQRECELWRDEDGDPVLDARTREQQYRIVEYWANIPMGDNFDCSAEDGLDAPVWCTADCSLIQSNFEDEELSATDACKKIIRRWTVVDWCTWDPNGFGNPDDTNDTNADQFQAVDDEWLDVLPDGAPGTWLTDYRYRFSGVTVNYDEFERVHGNGFGNAQLIINQECETCPKPGGVNDNAADNVYFRYTNVNVDGYYTFDQVIKIVDNDAPEIDVPATVTVYITDGAQTKDDDTDNCVGAEAVPASVSDVCGDDELSGDGITWWVRVWVSNAAGDRIALAAQRNFVGADIEMGSQTGGAGAYHLIEWRATDGCGNEAIEYTLVSFVDNKAPTPICIQDLSTAIMANGSVEIWAADYDNGSFDNCGDVEYFFLLDGDGNPTDDEENGILTANLLVTCEMIAEFGQGETLVLGLYVQDGSGNLDFCNITLNVNGAAEQCDLNSTAATIAGSTSTLSGDMIESAEVTLNVGARDLTSVEGQYMFTNNELSRAYDIKAEKNDDYINGVSVLDLVLIQKHVLGLERIEDPRLIIAADIDNNGRITTSDLAELRKLILGIYEELPNNSSWRFVDAAHDFDAAGAVFPFPEVLRIDNLSNSMLNEDFIGIKVGDVSGNAIANSAIASNRAAVSTLALRATDAIIAEGELVDVTVSSGDFIDVTGYQFTMELSGLEFVGATSGAIEVGEANFGVLNAKTITTAWAGTQGVSSDETLFTMTFKATANVSLSEGLTLTSSVAPARAYTTTLEELDVVLEYNSAVTPGFVLLQNTPNPFSQTTQIGFELPVAGSATLTVFDVTGKTVSVMTEAYDRGYNEITLRKSDLGTTGVLYYQLESGDFTATKKMVLID